MRPMTGEQLIATLHGEGRAYGTCTVSPTPRWPNALKSAGLDFVFIDTEHNTLDRSQVGWMCRTYAALGVAPIVRIPAPDPYQATVALDDGATGVVAPYIETVEQVQALRGAIKHRPLKGARLEARLRGESISDELDDYMARCNAGHVFIINIESLPAIDALDELLAVPELDGVLIGPHDLSCNLGVPEQYDHPDFIAAVKTIFSKARAAGVGAGIHFWGEPEKQAELLGFGANFLIHSADLLLVRKHLTNELLKIRELMGDSGEGKDPGDSVNI
jgi:2-keto-3-deoxy-L-rhamnonate aldolase RhmA